MAATYKTKSEARQTQETKATIVDRELDRLHKEHGHVTPTLVLQAAKAKKSPLHAYFEWEDASAAEAYRLEQAHRLIMSSKFVVQLVENGTRPLATVRRFIAPQKGEGFRVRNEALADPDAKAAFVATKLGELRSWCVGVADVPELQSIAKEIQKLVT